MNRIRRSATCAGVLVSLALAAAPAGAAPTITATDLGVLPGGTSRAVTEAAGINLAGVVVGYSGDRGRNEHAVVWDTTGQIADLGALTTGPTSFSKASGINSANVISGRSVNSSGYTHAVIWDSRRAIQDLGTLHGDTLSQADAINDAGQVVGFSGTTDGNVAVRWERDGAITALASPPGKDIVEATAVNAAGQAAGYGMDSATFTSEAVRWDAAGAVTVLNPLPGGTWSSASGINNLGQVVGSSDSSTGPRAVVWDSTGTPTDLGVIPGGSYSSATDINNAGQISGLSAVTARDDPTHAVAWDSNGRIIDLGTLPGQTRSAANAINDAGQVVGFSGLSFGSHAVLWEGLGSADQQLSGLIAEVKGVGPGKSLPSSLESAQASLRSGDTGTACSMLNDFRSEVTAQSGKKIDARLAAELIHDANQVGAAVPCP